MGSIMRTNLDSNLQLSDSETLLWQPQVALSLHNLPAWVSLVIKSVWLCHNACTFPPSWHESTPTQFDPMEVGPPCLQVIHRNHHHHGGTKETHPQLLETLGCPRLVTCLRKIHPLKKSLTL